MASRRVWTIGENDSQPVWATKAISGQRRQRARGGNNWAVGCAFWNGRTQERRERHGRMFSDCPYRYENKCNGRTILMQALMLARDQATVGCQGGRGKENFLLELQGSGYFWPVEIKLQAFTNLNPVFKLRESTLGDTAKLSTFIS